MTKTASLKSKNLLLIVPHLQVFIKDQTAAIKPYFHGVTALMPVPLFSSLVVKLPVVKKNFRFLWYSENSRNELKHDFKLLSPKFFTLPIDVMRKRNCYLASKSCVKYVTKNRVHFDLIHAHFVGNGFIGANLKRLFAKPLVVTAHGGDVYDLPFRDEWQKTLAKYILNEADQVITVSWFNKAKLLSLGISDNKLHVIPNGYNEQIFKPMPTQEAKKKLGLPLNKKVLLSVGNLVDVKGHIYLVDAMNIVLKKRNDVILVIVGSGSLKERLQKRVNALGLNGKILFVGGKLHCEIPMWMNACDIFVLPSLGEGFPTVIPEAMACGKPVIASCVGGIPEAITSNEIGTLLVPKSTMALSDAILEGLNRVWSREKILDAAARYSWQNIVKEIIIVYERALNNYRNC
jgi:glycosyltransferase involved in cell wall biosynthesis